MKNHAQIATQYARDVVDGKIPNCKRVIQACQRHLDDLARQDYPAYPYKFVEGRANAPCLFIECLPHTKGKWARVRQLIELEPWQSFAVGGLFGWVRKDNGRRRFREAYMKVSRKNGKSALAAGIGLYMFTCDGEYGAEVYSGATSEKQAWEVFRPAKLMLSQSPDLMEMTGAQPLAKSLLNLTDGSRFEPLINKPGDGSSPSCYIADEYHEHDTPDQVDTMITGMGAREQPLCLKITTAGFNTGGPCYEDELQACKVLDKSLENDEQFILMYGIDEDDDWTDPAVLAKANPNLGVSIERDWLESQQRQAVLNPANVTRFKTKHLNCWTNSRSIYFNIPAWTAAADPGLVESDFTADEGVITIDLASKNDICAQVKVFSRFLNGKQHFYSFERYWVPEYTIENDAKNAALYRKWVHQGYLTPCYGEENDFNLVEEVVAADLAKFSIREVAYDPWRATQLAHGLQNQGATVVEFRQTVGLMSGPMKELNSAILSGRWHHVGNPITTWMLGNVTAREDMKSNVFPVKENNAKHAKIDGAICLIMATGRLFVPEIETYPSVDLV